MERRSILERLGWRFIRIRGGEYYRNPDATIERVKNELQSYGIGKEANNPPQRNHYFCEEIRLRACELINEWHDERK